MVGMVPSRSRRQWGENQYLRPPYHFTEWSERSLTEYFRRAGFHPVEIQLDDYGYLVPRALGPLAHRTKTALMSSAGNPEGNPGHAASYHQVLTRMRSLKRLRDIAIAPAVLAEASIERTFGWAAHLLFKAQNRVPLT